MTSGPVARLLAHFGVSRPADVTWSHGVNSERALEHALGDPRTMMLEGDISWLPDEGGVRMAHPPESRSDLGFDAWIEAIARAGRGAKLDFKHPEVVARCLDRLEELRASGRLEIPILVNADVLPGPGGGRPRIGGAELLRALGHELADALPSLGFTTGRASPARYELSAVEAMLALCGGWPGEVTIPIRACFVADSGLALTRLLERPGTTLTLWNGRRDPAISKEDLLARVDPDRTFVDLIDADGEPLRTLGS